MATSAAICEPHRALLFALALLIHCGLYLLLVSPRHTASEAPERRTVLVFLRDTPQPTRPPLEVAPLAPPRLLQPSPPSSTTPQLIAPPEHAEASVAPAIDWTREAERVARERALAAGPERKDRNGAPKPKAEFGWSHSRVHRIEPMEGGGFIVWISDNCFIAIGVMAMPFCQLGKKPARGDLFEHMDDPPTPGDWKDP